jgi:hypothetical protein
MRAQSTRRSRIQPDQPPAHASLGNIERQDEIAIRHRFHFVGHGPQYGDQADAFKFALK